MAPQAAQAAPAGAQAAAVRVVHVVPVQHPLGHEVASQRQAPETQCWPTRHFARLPHLQPPLPVQVSARMASQAAQSAPPVPQAA